LGADKVGVNTATFTNLSLISSIADKYGAQAVVGSIQARREGNSWTCLVEQGRDETGIDLIDNIHRLIAMGVGELLVTSINNDGVQAGFDLDLGRAAAEVSSVPVVLGGGCGSAEDVIEARRIPRLSGVSIASAFHFNKIDIRQLKQKILHESQTWESAKYE
jgi:cyclase